MHPKSDLKILKRIHKIYMDEFKKYKTENLERSSIIYVPIDVEHVAKVLKADPQMIFGRLYYDIDKRYRYNQDDGSKVYLFAFKVGDDMHAVNFPLLEGVIAGLIERSYQFWLPIAFSVGALLISLFGVILQYVSLPFSPA